MPHSYIRCQHIEPNTKFECETWYPYEEGQKFCPDHRISLTEVNKISPQRIPRTVSVVPQDRINSLNDKISTYEQMSPLDLVNHIRSIEDQIRSLEQDRRAATIAKRNLEEKLTDDEKAALRLTSRGFHVEKPVKTTHRKSPEEKAKNKMGFSAWAARFGMKTEELMLMDDEELSSRIAKYKASKQA